MSGSGDGVVLASGGSAPVVWTGSRRQRKVPVVRIRAGALDRQTPARDLIVSADHRIFLDGVLVQAGLLVGETIIGEPCAEMVFAGERLERIRARLRDHAMA